jgi:hypothetical protein
MAAWQLTIRHGPRVERERFESLGDAIEAMRARAEEIRREGPLAAVKAFREYEPARRVAARLELSNGGWLRGRDAGIDVMGDGSLVPYSGGIRKRTLDGDGDPFAAVREALG